MNIENYTNVGIGIETFPSMLYGEYVRWLLTKKHYGKQTRRRRQ